MIEVYISRVTEHDLSFRCEIWLKAHNNEWTKIAKPLSLQSGWQFPRHRATYLRLSALSAANEGEKQSFISDSSVRIDKSIKIKHTLFEPIEILAIRSLLGIE